MTNFLLHWRRKKMVVLYLAGGLSAPRRRAFELHLEQCPQCRELLAEEKKFNQEIYSTKTLLDSAWGRTQNRLKELPHYAGSFHREEQRSKYRILEWRFWDWKLPTSFATSIVALIILVFLIFYYSFVPLTPYNVSKSLGEGLWVQTQGETGWQRLKINDELQSGDRIRADNYGQGLITFGKVGQVWLNHSTEIRILNTTTTIFEITHGEVYVALNHYHRLFQVKTPQGLVQVYGTEFQIMVDTTARSTKVACFENTVYFDNPRGRVVLPIGYQTISAAENQPTIPSLVDLAQIAYWKTQFDQLTRLPDNERKQLHKSFVEQGDLLFDNKKYTDALEHYQEAIFLDPNDYVPYYGIGRSYRELGQFGLATATYLRVLSLKPDEYAVIYQYSLCLLELKQYQAAQQILLHAINKRPLSHTEWVYLGNAYLLDHQTDKAEQAFRQAQKLGAETFPEWGSQIYGGLAEIARQRGDYKTSLYEITKALQSQAVPSLVYAEAAWIYRDKANPDDEKSAWQNYLKIDPKGCFAQEAKDRLTQLSPY